MLLLLVYSAWAIGPECRWACDDPVCQAVCEPVCAPAACTVQCTGTEPVPSCSPPRCRTRCQSAANSSPSDSCPGCETVCEAPSCRPSAETCEIVCEQLSCGWKCRKPTHCQRPRCELQCEHPTCVAPEESRASTAVVSFLVYFAALMLSI